MGDNSRESGHSVVSGGGGRRDGIPQRKKDCDAISIYCLSRKPLAVVAVSFSGVGGLLEGGGGARVSTEVLKERLMGNKKIRRKKREDDVRLG